MYKKCTKNVQKMYKKCRKNVEKMYQNVYNISFLIDLKFQANRAYFEAYKSADHFFESY